MGCMHAFKLKLEEQRLCTGQRLRTVNLLLDKHKLTEDVIDDAQVRMRIVFVWLHNLCSCVAHSRWLSRALAHLKPGADHAIGSTYSPPFLFFCTLLKEDFPQNVLFLAKSVIILYIVVVRLVEDAI